MINASRDIFTIIIWWYEKFRLNNFITHVHIYYINIINRKMQALNKRWRTLHEKNENWVKDIKQLLYLQVKKLPNNAINFRMLTIIINSCFKLISQAYKLIKIFR